MYAYIDMYIYAYMYIHTEIPLQVIFTISVLCWNSGNVFSTIDLTWLILNGLFLCHTDLWQLPWELEVINIDKDYSMLLYILVCHQKQWWSFYSSVKRWGCFGETYVHLCCLFRYLWLCLEIKIINYIYIFMSNCM